MEGYATEAKASESRQSDSPSIGQSLNRQLEAINELEKMVTTLEDYFQPILRAKPSIGSIESVKLSDEHDRSTDFKDPDGSENSLFLTDIDRDTGLIRVEITRLHRIIQRAQI